MHRWRFPSTAGRMQRVAEKEDKILNKKEKDILGLKAAPQDEETTREIVTLLRKKELTVDRASRILADAQTMLPLISKLPTA